MIQVDTEIYTRLAQSIYYGSKSFIESVDDIIPRLKGLVFTETLKGGFKTQLNDKVERINIKLEMFKRIEEIIKKICIDHPSTMTYFAMTNTLSFSEQQQNQLEQLYQVNHLEIACNKLSQPIIASIGKDVSVQANILLEKINGIKTGCSILKTYYQSVINASVQIENMLISGDLIGRLYENINVIMQYHNRIMRDILSDIYQIVCDVEHVVMSFEKVDNQVIKAVDTMEVS